MNRSRHLILMTIAAAVATATVAGADGQEPVRQSFDLAVPHPPQGMTTPAGHLLVYELHLTSFAREPLLITRIEALDADTQIPLGSLEGESLRAALATEGLRAQADDPPAVEPGRRAIVYWDLPIRPDRTSPRAIRHRVTSRSRARPLR